MRYDSYYEQRWSPTLVTPDTWYDEGMFQSFEVTDGSCPNCSEPIGWINGEWIAFYAIDEDGEHICCRDCYEYHLDNGDFSE